MIGRGAKHTIYYITRKNIRDSVPNLKLSRLNKRCRLDKRKFFINGAGIFTGLTAALFPLTVIKTRMMALEGAPPGIRGVVHTVRDVVHHDGVRGLYKGFGTVLCGLIPARMLYLATLEATKSGMHTILQRHATTSTNDGYATRYFSDAFVASMASFFAGGTASLAGQLVIVPIDVVSQRLMIMGGGSDPHKSHLKTMPRVNGLQLARQIINEEGVAGLYRGFGASVVTFVPSSAIWWASYGAWQTILWDNADRLFASSHGIERSPTNILGVQIVSGVLTGCTSAFLTNPLDTVKTRLQTAKANPMDGSMPTWKSIASSLLKTDGISGFFRGIMPRMISTSIWGTAMVTTYEFLKRMCAIEDSAVT